MSNRFILVLPLAILAACSAASGTEQDAAPADANGTSDLAGVTVASLSATRSQAVEDQFVTCTHDREGGGTTTFFFLIVDGAVKSYSQMQNRARDMCDAGQPGCGLGWQGDKVGLYYETPSGAVNQQLLDLGTLTLQRRLTTTDRGIEETETTCETGPHPDGVVIE